MAKYIGLNEYKPEINKKVIQVKFYIDLLNIRVTNLASRKKVEVILNATNEQFFRHEFVDVFESKGVRYPWKSLIGYSVKINRPSDELLEKLEESLFRATYTINKLEVAADLLTRNTPEACELMKLLSSLVVAKCNSKKPTAMEKFGCETGSAFFGRYGKPKSDPKMFKMYLLKKGNPKHGSPALHTEVRLNSAKTLQRQGVDVFTDLIGLSYPDFLERHVCIRQVIRKEVGDAIRKKKGLSQATRQQVQMDFEEEFGREEFLAHQVFRSKYCNDQCFHVWPKPWDIA